MLGNLQTGGSLRGQTILDALRVLNVGPLRDFSKGRAEVTIGLLDGPIDSEHPNLRESLLPGFAINSSLPEDANGRFHATHLASVIVGKANSECEGIVPDCRLIPVVVLHPAATRAGGISFSCDAVQLAEGIVRAADQGVQVINLSVGTLNATEYERALLDDALAYAASKDVVVVASVGNEGCYCASTPSDHVSILPVGSCDDKGRMMARSNVNRAFLERGLLAPGFEIQGCAPDGNIGTQSGTSVATAFVTGIVALLRSLFPTAGSTVIRYALVKSVAARRPNERNLTPDVFKAFEILSSEFRAYKSQGTQPRVRQSSIFKGGNLMQEPKDLATGFDEAARPDPEQDAANLPPPVSAQTKTISARQDPCPPGEPCADDADQGQPSGEREPPKPIYVIGRVTVRFPTPGIQKEYEHESRGGGYPTEAHAIYDVLSKHPHIARRVCYVLKVQGVDAYILQPATRNELRYIIETLKPVEPPAEEEASLDVIIGWKGPIASPEMCVGLAVPIVIVENAYSFTRTAFLQQIKESLSDLGEMPPTFQVTANDLLNRILQIADNFGELGEHRALNYVAARYPLIYQKAVEMANAKFKLDTVAVRPSRLTGVRKVCDVIFHYRSYSAPFGVESFFVRVDTTEIWPFIVSPLSPFFER